jgi:hypothetical protein
MESPPWFLPHRVSWFSHTQAEVYFLVSLLVPFELFGVGDETPDAPDNL